LQIFFVPGLRHAWHWLGMRPVSRSVMSSILASGGSVALCPGGVKASVLSERTHLHCRPSVNPDVRRQHRPLAASSCSPCQQEGSICLAGLSVGLDDCCVIHLMHVLFGRK